MKKGCFIRFIYLVPVVLIISAGCTKIGREEKDNFAFSHKFHIEQGVQCLNCHEGIQTSESSGFELPTEDTCAQCHNETQESPGCEKCHTNPAAAEKFLPKKTNLIFSHKNHIPRVKNDCTACHISVSSSRSIKDNLLPPMDSCVNCHSDSVKNLKCSQCHTDLGSYDLKPITHLSHKGNFLKEHQDFARADVSVCSQCHRESFCSDCHSRTEGVKPSIKFPELEHRSFIHRGDWISRHPLEARADQNSCLKCHDVKMCSKCHEISGAKPSRLEQPGHPSDWLVPGSRNFHGRIARRDITLCASCHDAGPNTNCIACHRAGKGVKIHPPGFKSSLDKDEHPTCKLCH